MVTLFSKLHDAIKKEAEAVGMIKRRTITKKAFIDDIKLLCMRYQIIVDGIGALPDSDKRSMASKIYTHKNDSKYEGCAAYINMVAECKTQKDMMIAFDSFLSNARAINNVLANFQANIDILFEGGGDVNIHTAKLSHLALFGFMESAENYAEYIMSMLSVITYELVENDGTKELNKPLPYRYKYLNDKYQETLAFHRSMLNGGHRTYLDAFKELKKSMDDVKVANPDTGSNIELIEDSKLVNYSHRLFGQFSLNPFKWLGEQWNLIRNNKYVKIASEKEAMIAHVNLLQMDLAQKDPNSPEYVKTVKVIDSYNQMIAKMNQKLEKYYGPEN